MTSPSNNRGVVLKIPASLSIVLTLAIAACAAHGSGAQRPAWTLRVKDTSNRELVIAKVRFSDEFAGSCIADGGGWKRLIVESRQKQDEKFFPSLDEWSYMINADELTIGRNGTCDAYLRLRGKFDGIKAEGPYYVFGITGGQDLGRFEFSRIP